jgi:hypothetical protein
MAERQHVEKLSPTLATTLSSERHEVDRRQEAYLTYRWLRCAYPSLANILFLANPKFVGLHNQVLSSLPRATWFSSFSQNFTNNNCPSVEIDQSMFPSDPSTSCGCAPAEKLGLRRLARGSCDVTSSRWRPPGGEVVATLLVA